MHHHFTSSVTYAACCLRTNKNSTYSGAHHCETQPSFPVTQKVGNVDLFVLPKFENVIHIEINQNNKNSAESFIESIILIFLESIDVLFSHDSVEFYRMYLHLENFVDSYFQ